MTAKSLQSRQHLARLAALTLIAVAPLTAGCTGEQTGADLEALPSSPPASTSPSPQEESRSIFDGTQREWLYAYAGCMEDGGFAVKVNEEQGNFDSVDLPPEQYDAWNSHMEKCGQKVGDPKIDELTDAQVRDHFDDYLATANCLEELGYEISEPPSRESWVKSWDTALNWMPHGEVSDVIDDPSEWERVNQECPQPQPLT